MKTLRAGIILTLTFLIAAALQAQNQGRAVVTGSVKSGGEPIPGVTVVVRTGSDEAGLAITEMDGKFHVPDLRPGSYVIEANLDGFQPVAANVALVTGQVLSLALNMVPAFGESVEVIAEQVRTGEVAVLDSRRESAVVSDSISSEEIRRNPDSDAAGVVERLTGVTLVGNKYVFVRGLGERYSGTTINGATLPTTETEKRVVPLDLFPAKHLETVNVVKTYTPDRPGDFGSGFVEMTTTQFPDSSSFKLTLGAGYTDATGGRFRRYAGGLDRWGDGGQALPSSFPSTFLKPASVLDPNGLSPQQLESLGESLIGDWTGRTETANPATDFALTFGSTFGRLGVVLSATSNHKFDTVDEEQRFFGLDGDQLVPRNDYLMTTDRESANLGFVGNFGLRLSDRSSLALSSVLTRDASIEDRYQEGLNTNTGGFIRDYRARYQVEEIFSSRLRGEHSLRGPGIGSLLDWNVAYSEASNESNLRENLYRESDAGAFALQTGASESGKTEFFDLQDEINQAGAAYTAFYAAMEGKSSGSIKAGFDWTDRTRDFGARRFRFSAANQLQFDLTGTPEEIFTAENIRPSGFVLSEVTGINDAYDASHEISAFFVMGDAAFGRWRFIGGARYEDSEQRVATFNPFDTSNVEQSLNAERDVLPSLNLVYQLGPRTNLRAAYGRSLNRPEFRELSPFSFVEITGGRSVVGNPELTQATLDGYDLRWEMFPGDGGVMATSIFYKLIDSPIERIIQPTTELRTSFVNAEKAELWGVELEFRRSLEILSGALRNWSVNFNYAYIDSEVTVGEQQLSVVTNQVRPLEGQSDSVGNLALQFLHPQWGTMARVLGSYSGDRITDVGAYGLPDIYEAAFTSIDVVLSQRIDRVVKGLEVKLAASNLLDEAREFRQGSAIQRRYEPGTTFSLSLGYSPF